MVIVVHMCAQWWCTSGGWISSQRASKLVFPVSSCWQILRCIIINNNHVSNNKQPFQIITVKSLRQSLRWAISYEWGYGMQLPVFCKINKNYFSAAVARNSRCFVRGLIFFSALCGGALLFSVPEWPLLFLSIWWVNSTPYVHFFLSSFCVGITVCKQGCIYRPLNHASNCTNILCNTLK